ncbi:MAG: UvrD-helicase domain-containing protein, partial [Armatimonadota bacterium]
IREIVDGGELRVGEKQQRADGEGQIVHRAPTWRDFGILFAAMTDVGIYEYALRREGIPFYTVAGRGFYNRQEIRDCINLLSALENLSDELSLVGALRSPMFAISDDTLYWLTRPHLALMGAVRQAAHGEFEHQAHIAAEQRQRLERAVRVIDRLRDARDRLTLSELMERVAGDTGLASVHLTQFAGRQAAANIRKLADLARSFEAAGEYSLRRFVEYLQELVVSEEHEGLATVHEEASDVVRLLTVHKAKGLEWPIVIVPDLARVPRGGSGDPLLDERLGPVPKMEAEDGETTWGAVGSLVRRRQQDQEIAERRRLLYVALTRARDHLILSASYELNRDGTLARNVDWLRWLTDAFGIDLQELSGGRMVGEDSQWSCLLTVPEREAEDRPAGQGFPDRAEPEVLARAAEAASGGAADLPPLALPIEPGQTALCRFTVTELVHYRTCPRLYMLRHLLDLPERPGGGDWLSSLSAADRGAVAHAAMEAIGRRGMEEGVIEQALEVATFPHAISSRLAPAQRDRLREIIRWFVHDAPVDGAEGRIYQDWIAAADRLRGEVQFAVTVDGVLVEGTIDALAEHSDGHSCILDYKTGGAHERKLDEYRFQIGLYCAALQAAGRPTPEAAALVLLDQRRVERLDPAEQADGARRELARIVRRVREGHFEPVEPCPVDQCALAYACETA